MKIKHSHFYHTILCALVDIKNPFKTGKTIIHINHILCVYSPNITKSHASLVASLQTSITLPLESQKG